MAHQTLGRDVYIVDGMRTPFLKARNKIGAFSAADLAVQVGRSLLNRHKFQASNLDEVILGCVMPSQDEANIARLVALRLGCHHDIPAWTVQRNCASGMQALDSAIKDIACGRYNLVLAGGTEAMSHAPLIFNSDLTNWIAGYTSAKHWKDKLALITKLRPHYIKPIIALLRGLRDPYINLSMGQTAENLAYLFNISRAEMDHFSLTSHQRVASAQEEQHFHEVCTLYDTEGYYYQNDDGVRSDGTMEKLAKLKPFFDRPIGTVTAGNSSQVTDGAALLILASEEAVNQYHLPVIARIHRAEWAGVEPEQMGLGPVYATNKLLNRQQLDFSEIDFWEINEAFAAQVLSCLAAFDSDEFCQQKLGLPHKMGMINAAQLNVDGGAIALGHPVGASGARIVLHLASVLKRKQAKKGIATICIGGGQGGSMLIENISGVSHG